MDAHERWYYQLYNDDHFYNEIRNGLNTLVSLNVNHFLDARCEVHNFCAGTHHPTSTSLCGPCTITYNLLEEMDNDDAPDFLFFYDV